MPVKLSSNSKPKILDLWNVSREDLNQLIEENPSLRGMLLGYVAEFKLKQLFESIPEITKSFKHDDHNRIEKYDRSIVYKGQEFRIEVKSLQTNSIRYVQPTSRELGGYYLGKAQVDASDRRNVTFPDGVTLSTTCLLVGDFDLLAVNLFGFENEWRFAFAKNSELPRSKYAKYTPYQHQYLLASSVTITWPLQHPFYENPLPLLDEMVLEGKT